MDNSRSSEVFLDADYFIKLFEMFVNSPPAAQVEGSILEQIGAGFCFFFFFFHGEIVCIHCTGDRFTKAHCRARYVVNTGHNIHGHSLYRSASPSMWRLVALDSGKTVFSSFYLSMKCMVDDDDGKHEVCVWELTGELDWMDFSCMLAELCCWLHSNLGNPLLGRHGGRISYQLMCLGYVTPVIYGPDYNHL
jgi:hypothetical protein